MVLSIFLSLLLSWGSPGMGKKKVGLGLHSFLLGRSLGPFSTFNLFFLMSGAMVS